MDLIRLWRPGILQPHRLTCVALLCAVAPAWSQTRDLRGDLQNLNVRHRTEHYALAGTVSDARLAEYGKYLEYIHREYAKGFARLLADESQGVSGRDPTERRRGKPRTRDSKTAQRGKNPARPEGEKSLEGKEPLADRDDRFKVVILATPAEYDEFGSAYFGKFVEHTRGLFVPAVQTLLICDAGDPEETYGILFHEAFHQFAARYVSLIPTWLNEGLATYYGSARLTRSGLVIDRPVSGFYRVVRDAVSAKQLIPLPQLMREGHAEFYSRAPLEGVSAMHMDLAYAQSYTLVAYLLSNPEGADHLRGYIRDLARATTATEAREATRRRFPPALLDRIVPEWLAKVNRGL